MFLALTLVAVLFQQSTRDASISGASWLCLPLSVVAVWEFCLSLGRLIGIVAPNLGNYPSGNCTNKVKHSFQNTELRQLRSDTPAAKFQYIVPSQSLVNLVAS